MYVFKLQLKLHKNVFLYAPVYTIKNIKGINVIEKITYQDGSFESFTWDENLRKTAYTDRNGHTTYMTYDAEGNLLTETDPLGNTTSYTYEPAYDQIETITDPNNNVTAFSYDDAGNLVAVPDPLKNSTIFQYDAYGQLDTKTDPNNNTTFYDYDSYGNPNKVTNSLEQSTSSSYDILGNRLGFTDVNENTTLYEYDLMNNLSRVTYPDSNSISYQYDDRGNIISQTDAKGYVTNFDYNVFDKLTEISDPYGNKTVNTYDKMDNLTKEEVFDSSQNPVSFVDFQYDIEGRLTRTTDAEGHTMDYTYDPVGNKLTSFDGDGNQTVYTYYDDNKLKTVTDSEGGVTSYEYDKLGNITKLTDGKGNINTFTYDSLTRVVEKNSPDTGITRYTYDAVGNIDTKQDASLEVTGYLYDSLNRLVHIGFSDPSQDVSFSYDTGVNGKGRLTKTIDPSGVTTFQYDKLGRLLNETKEIDSKNYSITYKYDDNGNLLEMIYPGGRKITFTHDLNNRITAIHSRAGDSKKSILAGIEYLPFGPIEVLPYNNGITTQMDYYQNLALKKIDYNPLSLDRTYAYDHARNITQIATNTGDTVDYSYDYLNQVIGANSSIWGTREFTYDSGGNRSSKITDFGITNYGYNANRIDQATGIEAATFTHDLKGNITSNGNLEYIYNLNNRLIRIDDGAGTVADYYYDGEGKRTKKKVGEKSTLYFYDQYGYLISEITGNDYTDYIYLGDMLTARGEATLKTPAKKKPSSTSYNFDNFYYQYSPLTINLGDLYPSTLDYYQSYYPIDYIDYNYNYWTLIEPTKYFLNNRWYQNYLYLDNSWYQWNYWNNYWNIYRDNYLWGNYNLNYLGNYYSYLPSNTSYGSTISTKSVRTVETKSVSSQETKAAIDTGSDNLLFYHLDHLNTPILLTDQDGTIVWEAEYLPFGETVIDEDPDGDGQLVVNNIRFPGQYYDAESGLYYNMMRYYDLGTGRYLTPDPIGFTAGDVNLYRYVTNNPIN